MNLWGAKWTKNPWLLLRWGNRKWYLIVVLHCVWRRGPRPTASSKTSWQALHLRKKERRHFLKSGKKIIILGGEEGSSIQLKKNDISVLYVNFRKMLAAKRGRGHTNIPNSYLRVMYIHTVCSGVLSSQFGLVLWSARKNYEWDITWCEVPPYHLRNEWDLWPMVWINSSSGVDHNIILEQMFNVPFSRWMKSKIGSHPALAILFLQ